MQYFLQDREATLQCVLCLRARVEQRKSYSCSTDCLRQHWGEHKNLHQNGRKPSLHPLQHGDLPRAAVLHHIAQQLMHAWHIAAGASQHQHAYKSENGYGHGGGIKDTHTFSNGGETWIEACLYPYPLSSASCLLPRQQAKTHCAAAWGCRWARVASTRPSRMTSAAS